MKEESVSYEQSKALKELGFDWPCSHYYCAFDDETDVRFWSINPAQSSNGFSVCENKVIADAPTQALAQKWLREVKGIEVFVIPYHIQDTKGYKWIMETDDVLFPSKRAAALYVNHESALSQGISQALTLLTESHAD